MDEMRQMVIMEEEDFTQMAPLSYWQANPAHVDTVTGGCGPGRVGDALIPDNFLGESVFLPCRKHDWMYHEGGSLRDKLIADAVFLFNLACVVNDESDLLDGIRIRMALTYYKAVRRFGGSSFTNNIEEKKDEKVIA